MIRFVFTTFSAADAAAAAVRTLVEEKLAACGSILPGVRSIYRWQGSVEDASEVMVIFKTSEARYQEFEQRLIGLHPYEVPEIVSVEPEAVAEKYAAWILQSTDCGG
jgi:periplasmic divalent cation tolerance protein